MYEIGEDPLEVLLNCLLLLWWSLLLSNALDSGRTLDFDYILLDITAHPHGVAGSLCVHKHTVHVSRMTQTFAKLIRL